MFMGLFSNCQDNMKKKLYHNKEVDLIVRKSRKRFRKTIAFRL